jgi:hypothetical protein
MTIRERETDILIVGGGTGGVAAAMAATAMGARVILTEPTAWLGGQLTSQAVPPDEHPWIEHFGCTRRYRAFRDGVRAYARAHLPLTTAARDTAWLNPGLGFVSRLCHEPRTALAVLDAMLAPARTRGLVEAWHHMEPVSAGIDGDRVTSVTLLDRHDGERVEVRARFVLDATELGDLLALAGIEYVTGAESHAETGEPHAVSGPRQQQNVQGFTHCLAVGLDRTPGANHVITRPAQYNRWRDYVPRLTPAWPGRMLAWTYSHPVDLSPRTPVLLPEEAHDSGTFSLWTYRRLIAAENYAPDASPEEVTLVNWPQNDFIEGSLIDVSPEARTDALEGAKELSRSLLYWMQVESPRPDGGTGYPNLRPRGDITGTPDGLAMAPYIRESRRIRALTTVTELHVGAACRGVARGAPGVGEVFVDSVGIGSYRIDLHPSTGYDNYIDIDSLPFTIPLGALLPVRVRNVVAACKNIGTTHVTNGCYRLHPVEWNIGEAAGLLAAHCLATNTEPHAIHNQPDALADFQALCIRHGFELAWPSVHAL